VSECETTYTSVGGVDGWESISLCSSTESMFLFTYLPPMCSARRLIYAHVFDIVFVVRHKWEVTYVK
jgi:hypothetical protein